MTPTKTSRLFSAIAAALTGALMLAGCTGGGAGSAESDLYTARVIDVLSGDTLRVQVKTAGYYDGGSGSGRHEGVEVPSETIIVKDPSFDAPAPGECGFEESRSYLVTKVFGQQGPERILEDSNVTVELSRETIETLPEALPETEGEVKLYLINYRNSPASVMLRNGYARVGKISPPNEGVTTRYVELSAWQDEGKRAAENNLWDSCWSE